MAETKLLIKEMVRDASKKGRGKKDAKGNVIFDTDDYGDYHPGKQTKLS